MKTKLQWRVCWMSGLFIILSAVLAEAQLVNGGFESGPAGAAPSNWVVGSYINNGLISGDPTTVAQLALYPGGTSNTVTYSAGAPESQVVAVLGTNATLRWPKFGTNCVVVNAGYYSQNVNVLKQTFTLAQNHLDPVTGCFNIRFAMAPVFNDAGVHSSTEYPYYYVVVRNLSNGITLYSDFSKAYRNGYAWKQAGSFAYTDWQLVDIPVDIDSAEVGDSIEFAFYAAACSSSSAGHSGRIYLDMVGEGLTGLYVLAQGSLAVSGTNTEIRYTLAYRNDSEKPRTNAVIGFTVPQGTVFSSIESGGLPYTTPGVGSNGQVLCQLGDLGAMSNGTIDVVVKVNDGTFWDTMITASAYWIQADNVSPLLGPVVRRFVLPDPVFDSWSMSTNSTAVLSFLNTNEVAYTVRWSTNMATPFGQWRRIGTVEVSGGVGSFSHSITNGAGFFRLSYP